MVELSSRQSCSRSPPSATKQAVVVAPRKVVVRYPTRNSDKQYQQVNAIRTVAERLKDYNSRKLSQFRVVTSENNDEAGGMVAGSTLSESETL